MSLEENATIMSQNFFSIKTSYADEVNEMGIRIEQHAIMK